MPERSDALAKKLDPVSSVIVVDNGSDLERVPDYTTIILPKNIQTTNGWLAGVDLAVKMYNDIFAFMFVITSAEIIDDDIVTPMADYLESDQNAVGIHPALTADSTTSWKQLIKRGDGIRKTWMIDNICSMYRADWWLKHPFDTRLIYAWGIDFETCYNARKEGRGLYVCDDVLVRKVTDIGYKMNRMNMTAHDRQIKARENMQSVLCEKYGQNWNWKMKQEFVTDDMR
jgi:hypothetical protein